MVAVGAIAAIVLPHTSCVLCRELRLTHDKPQSLPSARIAQHMPQMGVRRYMGKRQSAWR